MEKPKKIRLPIKVKLWKKGNLTYSVLFQMYDEFWVIRDYVIKSKRIILEKCGTQITGKILWDIATSENVSDYCKGRDFGMDQNGCAYRIKATYSRANLLRYIRESQLRRFFGGKVWLTISNSGYLFVTDNNRIAPIIFSPQKKIPITLSKVLGLRPHAGYRKYLLASIPFSVFGSVLYSLEKVIAPVMVDHSIFVDPMEQRTVDGKRQIILTPKRVESAQTP